MRDLQVGVVEAAKDGGGVTDERIKRPAYQWYVADADGDEIFRLMTYEQQGIYRALLDRQWVEGSIPAEPRRIFALLPKMKSFDRFQKLWALISAKFQPHGDDRLINFRLESQRRDLDAYIGTQSANGQKGAEKRWRGVATPMAPPEPSHNSSSSTSTTSTTTKKERTESSAALTPSEPAVLTFPTVGMNGASWALTQTQISEWQSAFPGIDILAEARKALAWAHANPGRRKTTRGMPAFLVKWFTRATDSGRARPPTSSAGLSHKTQDLMRSSQEFLK